MGSLVFVKKLNLVVFYVTTSFNAFFFFFFLRTSFSNIFLLTDLDASINNFLKDVVVSKPGKRHEIGLLDINNYRTSVKHLFSDTSKF